MCFWWGRGEVVGVGRKRRGKVGWVIERTVQRVERELVWKADTTFRIRLTLLPQNRP